MVNIGLIGYGYWGPNLARNFAELGQRARLVAVSDMRTERLQVAQNRYSNIQATREYRELLDNTAIDAILIATPVSTHFKLAKEALLAGKHVLVEKPMTSTMEESDELIDLARRAGKVLLVDHPFIYTSAVRKIKDIIDSGGLGDLLYIDSVRINLGLFQEDVKVIYDLAVHDISILDYLVHRQPQSVHAIGASHMKNGIENIAYLTLDYGDSLLAHIHVNWLAPAKVRTMIIGGTKNMIIYDEAAPSEKIKIYDRGVSIERRMTPEQVYTTRTEYRIGDMFSPKLDGREALLVEAAHFVDCIEKGERPLSGGDAGRNVVQILEAATRSLKTGAAVAINSAVTA